MKTNKTETFLDGDGNNQVADQVIPTFSVSSSIQNGKLRVDANLRFHPCTKVGEDFITSDSLEDRVVLLSDVMNSQDVDVLTCLEKIDAALSEFVTAKNI